MAIFNSLEEVKIFLSQEKFDKYSWGNSSKGLLEEINKSEEGKEHLGILPNFI